jgi:ethanolamine utilization protein EutA (predicted chaperonin)
MRCSHSDDENTEAESKNEDGMRDQAGRRMMVAGDGAGLETMVVGDGAGRGTMLEQRLEAVW